MVGTAGGVGRKADADIVMLGRELVVGVTAVVIVVVVHFGVFGWDFVAKFGVSSFLKRTRNVSFSIRSARSIRHLSVQIVIEPLV